LGGCGVRLKEAVRLKLQGHRFALRTASIVVMTYLIHHFLEYSADRFPDKQAVIQGRRAESYREIEVKANKIAHWLLKKGLSKGDRVGILLRNSPQYVAVYYGVLKSGAVVVPINTGIETREVLAIVKDASPRVFISEKHFSRTRDDLLKGLANQVEHILLTDIDGSTGECEALTDIYQNYPSERPNVSIIDMDLSSIIYTSGSTGIPKGVMLTHRNIVSNTRSIKAYLKLTSEDRCMVVLPFYYVYGKTLLNLHFFVGGSIVIDNHFTFPNAVLKMMIDKKVTGFSGVPSTFSILFSKSSILKMAFPTLRYLTQAGGHMSRESKEALMQKFPDKQIFIMYGATEASARLSYLSPEKLPQKMASIGKPIPNVEMKIVKIGEAEARVGEEGEIVARGSNVMQGYWNKKSETKRALKNGWYYTGDLGHMDEDGYFYVTGRKKDVIKTGLHKVSPKEIEEVLQQHPQILEVAVIAKPDETLGEAIKACIVLKHGMQLKEDTLLDFCEKHLPSYKMPQELEFMSDLPKNESGKILKQKLIQSL